MPMMPHAWNSRTARWGSAILLPWMLVCFMLGLDGLAQGQQVPDVTEAFAKIPHEARLLEFVLDQAPPGAGGHLQGIQLRTDPARDRQLMYLTHDSTTVAYLVIAAFPPTLDGNGAVAAVLPFPSDGQTPPLRHAGGIQAIDDVLVVGLEDNQLKTRSEVQFWNLAQPDKPELWPHLTIQRHGAPMDQTAGAVGIVKRAKDHLLAVANWDCRAIDFYTSNGKPLVDPTCRFTHTGRWQADAADRSGWRPDQSHGAYQAINLLADARGAIYLLGFASSAKQQDTIDLFRVDLTQGTAPRLEKLASKAMTLQGENHFRASGGMWIEQGRIGILSSEHALRNPTRVNVAR